MNEMVIVINGGSGGGYGDGPGLCWLSEEDTK